MNENIVYFDKKTRKKALQKARMRDKVKSAKKWIIRNQDWLMIAAPSVLGAGTAIAKFTMKSFAKTAKTVSNHAKAKKIKDTKNRYCYDRSLGHYWKLKRELTNADWVEIDRRKQHGERLSDILEDLNVLK